MLLPSVPTIPASGPATLDPLAVGLVEWWDFNQQSGSAVGRVNGLVAAPLNTGGVPFRVAGAEGWANQLLSARSQCYVVADNALIRHPTNLVNGSFTICGRDSIATFVANRGLAAKANSGSTNPEWFVEHQTSTQLRARIQTGTTKTVDSPSGEPISLNTFFNWRVWLDMVALTWNIQIGNGTKVSIAMGSPTFTPTNPTLEFGRYGLFLDGTIDWRAFYNRVLLDAEWTRLQSGGDSGRPLIYPFNALRSLTIISPTAKMVKQRNAWAAGTGTATFTIEGEYRGAAGAGLEVSLAGSAWQAASGTIGSGAFSVTVTFPVSQGTLLVRWTDAVGIVASQDLVGVGDVIGLDGQSNMDGRGFNNQPVTDVSSGFTPTMFDQDGSCRVLADPVNSATARGASAWFTINDSSAAGSYIPALVSAWQIDRQCPVMVVSSPIGSTTIAQHAPNAGDHYLPTTAYGCHNARCAQAGGVGFNLLHIGESDALVPTAKATFKSGVHAYADAFFSDRGVKSYFCLLQNCSGITDSVTQVYRDAITEDAAENRNVLLGPDFHDLLTSLDSDTLHIRSDSGLTTEGQRWYAAVKAVMGA